MFSSGNAKKWLDVNLRPPYDNQQHIEKLIKQADFVKLNSEELDKIANWYKSTGLERDEIKWFTGFYGCKQMCVTRGDKGAILYLNGNFFEHHGYTINAVDTVGAGDAFFAALISSLIRKDSPETVLNNACATGAFVASRAGAVPSYAIRDIENVKETTPKTY
jgi:fructokinase